MSTLDVARVIDPLNCPPLLMSLLRKIFNELFQENKSSLAIMPADINVKLMTPVLRQILATKTIISISFQDEIIFMYCISDGTVQLQSLFSLLAFETKDGGVRKYFYLKQLK